MKKKGFTLIELLAVIVILAIIALIATPIVMNVIESLGKTTAERSVENYLKAIETKISTERLVGNILSGQYDILSNGNLCLSGDICDETTDIDINVKGKKPSSGTILIENGHIVPTQEIKISINEKYIVSYNEEGKLEAIKKEDNNGSSGEEGTQDPSEGGNQGSSGEGDNQYPSQGEGGGNPITNLCDLQDGYTAYEIGAAYTCHLDIDRTFYVLENIEESENISLIMDRNFTDGDGENGTIPKTLKWCIDGANNNTTCQNINSKEEGTPLKHIQDVFGNSVTVSIPTASQIATASGKTFSGSNVSGLASWLCDYLDGTTNSVSAVNGYWTASPNNSNRVNAWIVRYDCLIATNGVSNSTRAGVRPVITISKTQLD